MDKVVSNSPSQEHAPRLVSPSHSDIALPSPPGCPESSIPIDGHFEGSHHEAGNMFIRGGRPRVTIGSLPDVALLEIFHFYVDEPLNDGWHRLVHVCQGWRNLVFGSSRRLRLRLRCKASTPVRETLDVWPLLPIVVRGDRIEMGGEGNILAALEHNDRICELDIDDVQIPRYEFQKILAATHQPFPAMTRLNLLFKRHSAPIIPDSFLGGSAPLLRSLTLASIPIPGLPKLLLSATHLVSLRLSEILHSESFSAEAMATCLSVSTSLRYLDVRFQLDGRPFPPASSRPQTRTLLPVLTSFAFTGDGGYLEDLVARIDAPLLTKLEMIFLHPPTFDTPEITRFISRTPEFKALDDARLVIFSFRVLVTLPRSTSRRLKLDVLHNQSDWLLSSLARVCSSSFPQVLISAVERLYLQVGRYILHSRNGFEDLNSQWLELLRPFTAVKALYVPWQLTSDIAPVFQELVGARVTEVLPALQALFLEEPLHQDLSKSAQEAIGQFVAARQLASRPIAVSLWKSEEHDLM